MRALFAIAAVFVACGAAEPPHISHRDAITGGLPAPDEHAVYFLAAGGDDAGTTCSATLIAPRTLLTAAHCIDPVVLGVPSPHVTATNDAIADAGATFIDVVTTRTQPGWNAATYENDLALLLLDTPQTATPREWNAKPLGDERGRHVRAIGYGRADQGVTGERRVASLPILEVNARTLRVGDLIRVGICFGDSGGPSLLTFEDGVERVVGVHSLARNAECTDGFDARVDVAADFIRGWLAEFEDPCLPNGLCAATACATPDVDCVPVASACARDDECASRACIADAQHPARYCSRPCDEGCGALECDVARGLCQRRQLPEVRPFARCEAGVNFCGDGSQCVDGRCLKPCDDDGDCDGQRCNGNIGPRFCAVPAVTTLPFLGFATGRTAGCSTGSGLLTLVALLLFHRRFHR